MLASKIFAMLIMLVILAMLAIWAMLAMLAISFVSFVNCKDKWWYFLPKLPLLSERCAKAAIRSYFRLFSILWAFLLICFCLVISSVFQWDLHACQHDIVSNWLPPNRAVSSSFTHRAKRAAPSPSTPRIHAEPHQSTIGKHDWSRYSSKKCIPMVFTIILYIYLYLSRLAYYSLVQGSRLGDMARLVDGASQEPLSERLKAVN